jgi:hypothetical protein
MWYFAIYSTLQRKSHLCIPFLGIAQPYSQFKIHVSVSDLYVPRIGPHNSCSRIGRSIVGIYINCSETNECGSWGCCCAISFPGIFVWIFGTLVLCSVGTSTVLLRVLKPELPLVSPYGDLAQRKVDYWRTNEGKNLKKIANPQAFSVE